MRQPISMERQALKLLCYVVQRPGGWLPDGDQVGTVRYGVPIEAVEPIRGTSVSIQCQTDLQQLKRTAQVLHCRSR